MKFRIMTIKELLKKYGDKLRVNTDGSISHIGVRCRFYQDMEAYSGNEVDFVSNSDEIFHYDHCFARWMCEPVITTTDGYHDPKGVVYAHLINGNDVCFVLRKKDSLSYNLVILTPEEASDFANEILALCKKD